jgi:hypothetical protein
MDRDQLLELVPHYLAMVVLVCLVLGAVRTLAGALSFWVELAIVFPVVFAYRPIVLGLGVGPSSWE